MPLFGKRKPLTDAEKQARRERLEMIGAVMADMGAGMQGGQGNQYANLMQRRQQLAQQQQLGAAFGDLLGQMRGPDTMTPQVNELIGAANTRGAQIGMAPMEMQTPRRAGLDYTDPTTRDAFMRYMMAGGNMDTLGNISSAMQPEKRPTYTLSRGQRVVDEAGNTIAEGMPYEESPLVVPQGGSVIFPGQQRFGLTNPKTFAPARPSAGRTGSGAVGPVKNQPTRVITY